MWFNVRLIDDLHMALGVPAGLYKVIDLNFIDKCDHIMGNVTC